MNIVIIPKEKNHIKQFLTQNINIFVLIEMFCVYTG